MIQSGLIVRPDVAVPLVAVTCAAELSGSSAKVVLAQRFHNVETTPVEAVYLFPLPIDAAVSAFSAEVDGKLVEGRVEPRETAFETYDDALADGHGAFLLDQERPNVFTLSVGNLRPGAEVTVRLTWVQPVPWEGGALRFTLPTTVSPRYSPGGEIEVGQPDQDKLDPERRLTVPYGLSFELKVSDPVTRIESPTHPIRTCLDPVVVSLGQREVALDRDVVIVIEPRDQATAAATVAALGADRYVQVSFVPDLAARDEGSEVVFLVDCSGSMDGDSIDEARRALELCIRALDPRDRFDIVRFGSSHSALFGTARAFDDTTLAAAVDYVRGTRADMGGTEILAPLSALCDRPGARQVLLLTDGQVSNEADVIGLAQRHADRVRIFTFGIGAGVSEHLVSELARVSRGAVERVAPGERIEPKVLRQFGRVRSPALTDVTVDWGGLEVEQAPRVVPPVFQGEPLTVWARVRAGTAGTVTLKAAARTWQVALDLERAVPGGPVPAMWGRAAIRDLESDSGRHGSSQQRSGREDKKTDKLVALGKSLGLVSSATSYVAVEVRAEGDRTFGATLRRVPIALTHGWGGSNRQQLVTHRQPIAYASRSAGLPAMPAPAMLAPGRARAGGVIHALKKMASGRGGANEADGFAGGAAFDAAPAPAPAPAPARRAAATPDALYTILLTQSANGSFPLATVVPLLGDPTAFDALVVLHGEAKVATAVVLAVLARDFGDRQAEWRAAADKAERFVAPLAIDVGAVLAARDASS